MPEKRIVRAEGTFPILSLIPFAIAPIVLLSFLIMPDTHLESEIIALASWYIGCLIAPVAFDDDDMGMMFWLYHFVLIMIPLANDIVWWTTRITPSNWWLVEGSTVPITWLLQRESPYFFRVFNQLALLLIPGCLIFLILMALKRNGDNTITKLSSKLRRTIW